MICMFCGTTKEDNFSLYHNELICDECLSVCNYHYDEMFKQIERIWHEHEPQFAEIELWESSLLEGLEEYIGQRAKQYEEQRNEEWKKRREEWNKKWQK